MEISEVLQPGQEVKVVTGKGRPPLTCSVKKIKENMVAVSMDDLKNKEEANVGGIIAISWPSGDGGSFKTKGEIIQNKSFPIVVARCGEIIKKAEEPTSEIPVDPNYDPEFDRKYVQKPKGDQSEADIQRESARVEDAFPIQFFIVEKDSAEQKKMDYLARSSKDRRDESKAASTELSEAAVRNKLSSANPAVAEVILDLYQKYAMLSAKVLKKEVKGGGEESSGTCIDLSGSGLQFLTMQQIKPKTIVKFIIAPPAASPPFSISAMGEVMRVEQKKDPLDRKTKYAYGTRFYAIHEDDSEEIIQYTFKRQQEMLKARRKMGGYD